MNTSNELFKSAKRALAEGENFLAYDLAEKIPDDPNGPSPQKAWVMALALARSGSLNRARELAELLPDVDDIDIIGFKSRIYKDLAIAERDTDQRKNFFLEAARLSADIFKKMRAWYNGINAASCLRMAGMPNEARVLVSEQVLPLCKAEMVKDMWLEATLGECHLLLDDFDESATHYSHATEMALVSGSFGDFGSTLRQLKMLSSTFPDDAARLWSHIALPSICVFSGHCIDPEDSATMRFPTSAQPVVRSRLDEAIRRHRITLGYSSCANGGDILFLEAVLSAGGHVWVVPPFPIETSIRMTVAHASGDWEQRLRNILANPHARLVEPECDITGENDDIAYDFTNRYILGQARLKSQALSLPLRGLAVWDGITPLSPGNTSSAVKMWSEANLNFDIISPEARA